MTMTKANVIQFPLEIAAQAKLRVAERYLQVCLDKIDNGNPVERACSQALLHVHHDNVAKAEAALIVATAGDTLRHKGVCYRAMLSIEGAN